MTANNINRQDLIIDLINENPNLSGNKILQEAKSKGFGIKKQTFYELFRDIRNLPEPTKEKREASVPIKFRKPKDIGQLEPGKDVKFPKKEGEYGIVEIFDPNTEQTYWIKYRNKKDLERQKDIIRQTYGPKNLTIISHGVRTYTSFIDSDFRELMRTAGIEL